MNLGLFEDAGFLYLHPLTWLRSAAEIRCGRDRLLDKVQSHFQAPLNGLWIRPALREAVGERVPLAPADPAADWCLINARTFVTANLTPPAPGVAWHCDGDLAAIGLRAADVPRVTFELLSSSEERQEWLRDYRNEAAPEAIRLLTHPWEPALWNDAELRRQCRGGGIQMGHVYPGTHLVAAANIQICSGAVIKPGAVLDAEDGPIYIDHGARIEPNAVLEGPCYVGPRSIVRPGAVLHGGTSVGPVCKVGGELEATIIHGYSNKQHDGFLGHSYVAEWVNLGADTVTSDLKNTYGAIRVSINGVGVETGQHFVGSIIGDHSKTGIGTILPTGCVIGVASSIFTHRSVPKFVPSFAWLTDEGLSATRVDKAMQIARTVMARRELELTPAVQQLLEHVAVTAREVEQAGWR